MVLEIKDITYQPQTSSKKILKNINLKVNEKEIILISGASGSGKTSLLEIISGLISEQEGNIFWKNNKISPRQRRWLCGIVFQFPERFFIGSTIRKELKIGHNSITSNSMFNILKQVGLSEINLSIPPENLSGGEQRRLAVAVQLLRDPRIILLDEPTAGLDWSMKNDVKDLINGLRMKNTIIIVTHEAELFTNLPTKSFALEEGRLRSTRRP
tara:strand:+ start:9229 stop:9867 length:639 start_codon:yes stop_codon:yes gene_type:complete